MIDYEEIAEEVLKPIKNVKTELDKELERLAVQSPDGDKISKIHNVVFATPFLF